MLDGPPTRSKTRRELLAPRPAAEEAHIASVLVHVRPDDVDRVAARLERTPGVERHGSNAAGKLIVTIEVDDDATLVERMTRIETDPDVIAATLVYPYAGELDDEA